MLTMEQDGGGTPSSEEGEYSTQERILYAQKKLRFFVENFTIFIDTCSLLNPAAGLFWDKISPLLQEMGKRIIVPLQVVRELQKHSGQREKPQLAASADGALKVLKELQDRGLIELRGEDTGDFADNVFLYVFTKFRLTNRLLLITQDVSLARDMEGLNNSQSVKGNRVYVCRVNQFGYLSGFRWPEEADSGERNAAPRGEQAPAAAPAGFTRVTRIPDTRVTVSALPAAGEDIFTDRGPVRLLEAFACGGEGVLYTTNTPYIAKIYKRENITKRKIEKINLLLNQNLKYDGICFPEAALYNERREFVGFLMPKAKGKVLQSSVFRHKDILLRNFPGWKKRDTVELCITILKKIQYLHEHQIIMGDINPMNILVVSPAEVYFVDTDSYQIEDFPCPVGTINFTAPEIQRKHFPDFLRTIGNENFAVATLLFMIMLPGKPPYSQQGGEDPVENIVRMDFSYPFQDNSNRKAPEGPWRFIWSHLTFRLKEAFYKTFRKDEAYSAEDKRLGVQAWLSIMSEYLSLLDSGKYGKQDPMSEELFPTRFKRNPNAALIRCRLCGEEAEEEACREGICPACLHKGESCLCERCGQEFLFTNYQKYVKKAHQPSLCPDCYAWGNETNRVLTCVVCGKDFELTNGEYEFYRNLNYELPKRCGDCRKAASERPDVKAAADGQSQGPIAKEAARGLSPASRTGSGETKRLSICVDCGKEFEMTDNTSEPYGERQPGPPERCMQCLVAALKRPDVKAAMIRSGPKAARKRPGAKAAAVGESQEPIRKAAEHSPSPASRAESGETKRILICADCGEDFEISESTFQFYKTMGFKLPSKCKKCRTPFDERFKFKKSVMDDYFNHKAAEERSSSKAAADRHSRNEVHDMFEDCPEVSFDDGPKVSFDDCPEIRLD